MIKKEKKNLATSILLTGRLLVNRINSHFSSLETNITLEQLDVLVHIAIDPDRQIIQNDLAVIMHKNKSAILRSIDILEKKSFVKRIPVPGDRRKNIIRATAEGMKITEKAITIFRQIEEQYMGKVSSRDAESCSKVLDIIAGECKATMTEQE